MRSGKFMVATYSVGQLLWLRACAALLVLLPMMWKQRADFTHLERPWLQLLRVTLSTLEVAGVLSRHRLSAARRRHHLLSGLADLRHRAVGHRARRARRLAALDRDPDRLLRRADCAQAVHANRQLAGDDRARRQPVVCGADADHALAARARPISCWRRRSSAAPSSSALVLSPFGWVTPTLGSLGAVLRRRQSSRSRRCCASTAR